MQFYTWTEHTQNNQKKTEMYIMLLVSGGALSSGNPVKKVKKKDTKNSG